MSLITDYLNKQFNGSGDPAHETGWGTAAAVSTTGGAPNADVQERMGFFTDTSICIGCKACEVACKEWNRNPEDGLALTGYSYDNTAQLGADTWRHVAFVEQSADRIAEARESGKKLASAPVNLGMPTVRTAESDVADQVRAAGGSTNYATDIPAKAEAEAVSVFDAAANPLRYSELQDFRWLMASDVCKHCTHAGCLDNCPTGALFRTEFGTVVVQADVCNGCGYCVSGCPFGVIERRETDKTVQNHGNAQKCTLCYDRLKEGQTPACAQTCPTTSIKFGTHAEMLQVARDRVAQLHAQGMTEARLYGANEADGVGGTGSIFLLLDDPEVYGLPPDPVAPTRHLGESYKRMLIAAGGMAAATALAFIGGGA